MSWHNMALVRIAGATAHRNVIPYSMSVYLVRHCSAEGQDPEAALTRAGKEQSLQLSAYLERQGLTRVISSPFRRAVDSARPLAETLGLEIEVDPRLAERQLGLVENGDWRAALRESFDDHNLCLPDGESSLSAQARGVAVLHAVFQETRLPTAIFCHGNLLALIANSLDSSLGFDFWRQLTNPDVFEVRRLPESLGLSRVWAPLIDEAAPK
jgi:2,3-bisphosphoglycerate-dependent phosphoglycerate mutase